MYNFVIFASPKDFYRIPYYDVFEMGNVRYMDDRLWDDNKFLTVLYRLHVTPKINRLIDLPFKNLWNPLYFRFDFKNKYPLCFIFHGRRLDLVKYGIIDYLKNKYSDAKFVCFVMDLVERHDNLDINYIKEVFDLVISYDYNEAQKLNIEYHHTVYSDYPFQETVNVKPSDVYFIGHPKNRLRDIFNVYEKLKTENISCEFYITHVSKKDRIYPNEIHYIRDMTYLENLKHVTAAKCLLEIMQENCVGYTYRTWEAIIYKKKILTNNIGIVNAPFYNKDYISTFNRTNEIDSSFLKKENDNIDYHYKDKLSPKRLLDFIELYFTKNS